jgi:DUF4097 and DUF4098 domain-containing protein YvlB
MRTSLFTAAIMATLLAVSAPLHADDGVFDQQVTADPRGVVEVSNISGRIEVTGWDQPQVSVHAMLSGSDKIDVRSDHGRTSIVVRHSSGFGFGFGGGDVDVRIKIPRGSELDVTGVSADVISTGVLGAQRLKTVSGSVRADIAQADVEAKTVSGEVVLRGNGKPAAIHITSISGSLRLEHGAGDLEATSTSGELTAQLEPGRSVRVHTISGEVSIRGKLTKDADVDGQTVSGSIRLHADDENGFEYEVTTFSGDIHNCFNAKSERTSQYGPGWRLNGSLGQGAAHVRLKTMSGDIDLCNKP